MGLMYMSAFFPALCLYRGYRDEKTSHFIWSVSRYSFQLWRSWPWGLWISSACRSPRTQSEEELIQKPGHQVCGRYKYPRYAITTNEQDNVPEWLMGQPRKLMASAAQVRVLSPSVLFSFCVGLYALCAWAICLLCTVQTRIVCL